MDRFNSSDSSSSDDSSVWTTSSSDSSCDSEFEDYQPESKRQKKNENPDKEIKLTSELNYDVVLKSKYKWVIKDYAKLTLGLKCGQKLESPVFTVGTNNEYDFQLLLYPKGINDANKNYVSLYLLLKSSEDSKIKLKFKCHIPNSKSIDRYVDMEESISVGHKMGFKRLLKTESAYNKSLGYIIQDALVLECSINAALNKTDKTKIQVIRDVESLLDTGSYSDVVLSVQDRKFKVHKYILAARSEYFASMFNHDMKERNENVVEITDFEPDVIEKLLRFTYTGEVKNLNDSAKELLAAADKYNFADLKKICENSLNKNLNVANVIEILIFANDYNSNQLKEQALEFFVNNATEVVDTEAYKSMAKELSPLMGLMISALVQKSKK